MPRHDDAAAEGLLGAVKVAERGAFVRRQDGAGRGAAVRVEGCGQSRASRAPQPARRCPAATERMTRCCEQASTWSCLDLHFSGCSRPSTDCRRCSRRRMQAAIVACDPKRVTLDACDAEHSHFRQLRIAVIADACHRDPWCANAGVSGSLDAGTSLGMTIALCRDRHKPGTRLFQRRPDQALGVLAVPLGGAEQAADLAAVAVEQQRRRQAGGAQRGRQARGAVGVERQLLGLGLVEELPGARPSPCGRRSPPPPRTGRSPSPAAAGRAPASPCGRAGTRSPTD